MKERPILMSAPMVRAILAGAKTQTRRIVKPPPCRVDEHGRWYRMPGGGESLGSGYACPYGEPGDRLWVREMFSRYSDGAGVWYWADGRHAIADCERPRPSIHMPRRLSRITLEVTAVRCERLKSISEEDALAEGIIHVGNRWESPGIVATPISAVDAYMSLWDYINGPGSWYANPFVWAISFKRVEQA